MTILVKARKKTTLDHIVKLIETLEPKMRRTFMETIARIKSDLDLKKIEELLRNGHVDQAINTAQKSVEKMADTYIRYTVLAASATAKLIDEGLNVIVSFDQTNLRAVQLMRENRLRMIREFTTEQRAATREALTAGIAQGLNPRAQALAFRDSIGLTRRQLQAVENYRTLLQRGSAEALTRALRDRRFDSTVSNAIAGSQALTQDQIDRMVDRYTERYLKYRSEVIARTEALRSAHQGTEEMFMQAIESGALQPDSLTREWVTAEDDRVRDSHVAMDGQQRNFGEPFISGEGNAIMYPGDPNAPASETIQCRCIVTTVFKEDANVQ